MYVHLTADLRHLTNFNVGHLVGYNLLGNFDDSRFRTFEREIYINYLHQMIPKDSAFPCFGPENAQAFCDSIKRIGPLCRSVQDLEYIALMQRIATQALTDPVRGKIHPWCLVSPSCADTNRTRRTHKVVRQAGFILSRRICNVHRSAKRACTAHHHASSRFGLCHGINRH